MSAPMLIVPNGWTVEMFDNFISNESIVRLRSTAQIGITQRAYEYGIPMHRLDNMEEALFQDVQRWIWMITGQTPPVPNPEWTIAPSPSTERWKTAAAKAALAKALDEPPPAKEPTLPPGITRHIELE